jgi:ABC-type branched-subunit amino acid transport system substrate-binding protein
MGMTRIAILQTDDSFGADSAAGADQGFATVGLKPVLVQKFPREKPDFAALAAQVKQSDAQAVLYIGTSGTVASGVKAPRATGSSAQVVTLSNNASEGFIKLLGEHAGGVIVSQVFPNERAVAYRLVKEAQELAKAKGLNGISPAMIEGFAAAKVLVEGLRRAGPKPTSASLRDALESLHKFDMGGLEISYSATDHSGLEFAELSIIGSDGKFMR